MPPAPIHTAHLFPQIEAMLVDLLRSLTPAQWELPTVAPRWRVKDIAAHLLDTQLRKLSLVRDGHQPRLDGLSPTAGLPAFVNALNAEGVRFYGRLSPQVLTSLLESSGKESAAFYRSLDPMAAAKFGVSWAGEDVSCNWFDTAREFTERWHHQQQIRLAVGAPSPGIMTRELYFPVLDCFLRALPHAYANATAPPDTVLAFAIAGDCGGTWYLRRDADRWRLCDEAEAPPGPHAARAIIPQAIAWQIFTNSLARAAAAPQIQTQGDRDLALRILDMRAVVV